MGGDVSATGQPSRGAEFVASIPLRPVLEAPAHGAPIIAPAGQHSSACPSAEQRSLSVLLVEDHAINRKLAEILLTQMGHTLSRQSMDRRRWTGWPSKVLTWC